MRLKQRLEPIRFEEWVRLSLERAELRPIGAKPIESFVLSIVVIVRHGRDIVKIKLGVTAPQCVEGSRSVVPVNLPLFAASRSTVSVNCARIAIAAR